MLINLSNHPSTKWEPGQLQTALSQFGEVIDEPFPAIDPRATTEAVRHLSIRYVSRCLELLESQGTEHHKNCPLWRDVSGYEADCECPEDAIHLMGEQSFCGAFVRQWDGHVERLVVSTTDRLVEELPNGEKRSVFHFVQFREI